MRQLKLYINKNTGLRAKAKNNIEKNLFKLLSIFFKFDELVSEPNFCKTEWFSVNILLIEINKIKVKISQSTILECRYY